MNEKQHIIVLDCGATNIRVVAIDCATSEIVAKHSMHNSTKEYNNEGLIWDIDEIFNKLQACCIEVMKQIPKESVKAVSTTTFGVDGTFLDDNKRPLYPIISWQCKRNAKIMDKSLFHYFDKNALFHKTGVGYFPFNTINKFIWFKENKPEVLEKASSFLFISSYINFKLTDVLSCDFTMLGTSMLTNLNTQNLSEEIAETIGYNTNIFKNIVNPGDIVGNITDPMAARFHLPSNVPVVSSGHDTQFAIFASGTDDHTPVLSSGTWEILMVDTQKIASLDSSLLDKGITIEFGCELQHYSMGIQWLASGIIEWVRRNFYGEISNDEEAYNTMISEVYDYKEEIDSATVSVEIDFLNNQGAIKGLSINSKRYAIYYNLLVELAKHLKSSLHSLENLSHFKAKQLVCVGGGSKNKLWNQIKADTLNIPIIINNRIENTVLGASYYAMQAITKNKSASEIRDSFKKDVTIYNPAT